MKRLLWAGLLLATACVPLRPVAPAIPQEISGLLPGTTRLSGEVLVSGDILVPAGSTLLVSAGTVLRIRKAESTKIDPEYLSPATEILVRGTLLVEGSAAAPVQFIPEHPAADGEVAWAGLLLDHATDSSIRYGRIEQAEQGVLCIASAPQVSDTAIRACRYGVVAQAGSHPHLLNNRIEQGEGGVFCWQGSNPYLKYNHIVDNAEEGIFVDAGSRPWLDRNTVTGNAIGLALYPRDLPFDSTEIRANREDIRYLGEEP